MWYFYIMYKGKNMDKQAELVIGIALVAGGFAALSHFAGIDLFRSKTFWMIVGIVMIGKGWGLLLKHTK